MASSGLSAGSAWETRTAKTSCSPSVMPTETSSSPMFPEATGDSLSVNKDGIWEPDQGEIGIPLVYTKIRYRDGHNSNSLTTDFNGVANFNETFPLFNWYVIEADSGRYNTTRLPTGSH